MGRASVLDVLNLYSDKEPKADSCACKLSVICKLVRVSRTSSAYSEILNYLSFTFTALISGWRQTAVVNGSMQRTNIRGESGQTCLVQFLMKIGFDRA